MSLNDRLTNLLMEEWTPNIDYQKYFDQCAPKLCTYIDASYTSMSYTVTLLLSLYGGLIIILRLLAVSLVNIMFILKRRLANSTTTTNICMLFFI